MKALVTHKSAVTEKGYFEVYFDLVDEKDTIVEKDIKIVLNVNDVYPEKIIARSADAIFYEARKDELPEVIELPEELINVSID